MAKLYFNYSTMNAGKSTLLLQASYNYIERGMQTYLLTANFDDRAGKGQIGSRIGISAEADTYAQTDDLFAKIAARLAEGGAVVARRTVAKYRRELGLPSSYRRRRFD